MDRVFLKCLPFNRKVGIKEFVRYLMLTATPFASRLFDNEGQGNNFGDLVKGLPGIFGAVVPQVPWQSALDYSSMPSPGVKTDIFGGHDLPQSMASGS